MDVPRGEDLRGLVASNVADDLVRGHILFVLHRGGARGGRQGLAQDAACGGGVGGGGGCVFWCTMVVVVWVMVLVQ